MRGKMQRNQDFIRMIHGKSSCMCQKAKEKSVVDNAFSTHVAANDKDDKISNKQKVVFDSKSSSSSNDEISVEKVFSCSSCPRKFSSQQALAGHRNTHKSEWEALLDLPDDVAEIEMNKIMNKQKVVAACNSSSSSNNDISKEIFSYSSGPHKFSSKQALTGHRDTLKSEGELRHDVPVHGNIQRYKLPCHPKPSSSFIDLKIDPTRRSLGSSSSIPRGKSSTNHKPLLRASQYPLTDPIDSVIQSIACACWRPLVKRTNTFARPLPSYPLDNVSTNNVKGSSGKHSLASLTNTLKSSLPLENPTNTFKGPSAPASQHINSASILLGPSIGTPYQQCVHLKQHMVSNWDRNHPLDNSAVPQGKTALGVRCESTIHKVRQGRHLGQTDLFLRAGSASFGRKQVVGDNIMLFGTKINRNYELRSLSTAAVSDSKHRSEGEGNSKAQDLFSSSFQPKNGRKLETHDFFPLTPAQATQNYDYDHSSQGLLPQPDHDGVDVDLNLKL